MKNAKGPKVVLEFIQFAICAVLAFGILGCSVLSPAPLHGFTYEVFPLSGAELLDWRYGSLDVTYRRANPYDVARGKLSPSGGATGFMGVGDHLYVKWRIIATGKILEETVDFRRRLPRDMTGHTIYFEIDQGQLKVYLATPKRREKGEPMIGPLLYQDSVVIRLHPRP